MSQITFQGRNRCRGVWAILKRNPRQLKIQQNHPPSSRHKEHDRLPQLGVRQIPQRRVRLHHPHQLLVRGMDPDLQVQGVLLAKGHDLPLVGATHHHRNQRNRQGLITREGWVIMTAFLQVPGRELIFGLPEET